MPARVFFSPFRLAVCLAAVVVLAAAACSQDPLVEIRKQQAAGNFAASVEPLRELLSEDRHDPEVNYLYGVALTRTGQTSLAEWSLRKAMDSAEWRLPAGRQLAYGELLAGNFASTIETLDPLIEEYPDDPELLLMRANARAHSRMNLEQVLEDVDRLLEIDPDNVEAMEPRILALLGLDRAEEAAEAIDELGRRIEETGADPELQGWHCATAALFAKEDGNLELAESRFADCSERFPGHANVVSNAVGFYDERRQFDRSLEILERAAEADPRSRQFRVYLADRLRTAGRSDEALDRLLVGTQAEDAAAAATAWFDVAKHHQQLDAPDAAVEAFEKSMELARSVGAELPQMKLEYADALMLAGRFEDALRIADDMSVAAHRELVRARVAQEQGDPEQALAHFEESFRLWPDNPWARYYAAIACETLGDFDRAIENYRYSIRIAAGATDARERLARLHLAEGRPTDAIYMLRVKAEQEPLSLEGEMLTLEVWGRIGDMKSIRIQLDRIRKRGPHLLGDAAARAAKGVRGRAGPGVAVDFLRKLEGLDFSNPRQVAALRTLVGYSGEAGRLAEAIPAVEAALAAHPDFAAFHEIAGQVAESRGDVAEARSRYRRAIEIDPKAGYALSGLGRAALAEDPAAALGWFEKALEPSPFDPDANRGAARALDALGRPAEAIERLATALLAHPYEAEIASQLADLLAASPDADAGRIEGLQQRASRFSPSPRTSPSPPASSASPSPPAGGDRRSG